MSTAPAGISAILSKFAMLSAIVILSVCGALAQAQASSADLIGTVLDPNGAIVPGATVTVRDPSTGITRSAMTADDGSYSVIGLPPGEYEVTAEAATFKRVVISPVRLTVGQRAELRINMEIGAQDAVVTVSGDSVELIETTSSTVSNTIDQRRIESLPINERSATGFALTLSTIGRDNGRPIGPAPTSGLNVGGQRGRSTLVEGAAAGHWLGLGGISHWPAAAIGAESTGPSARTRWWRVQGEGWCGLCACVFIFFQPITAIQENN